MSTAALEIQQAKEWLAKEPFHEQWNYLELVRYLEQLVGVFNRTGKDQHREIMSEFHNCAGRFPYFQDNDIGALILESAADSNIDPELCKFLYNEAKLRALWCVRGATAGGEGLSRMVHVRRIDEKLR